MLPEKTNSMVSEEKGKKHEKRRDKKYGMNIRKTKICWAVNQTHI